MRTATVRLQCSASMPTALMPILQAVVLLTLKNSSAQFGPSRCSGLQYRHRSRLRESLRRCVSELSQGLELTGHSDSGARFGFSNPLAPMFGLLGGGYEQLATGPLIAHADTSWIFHGGHVSVGPDNGGSVFPIPVGYSTCEAAGFIPLELAGVVRDKPFHTEWQFNR